MIGHAESLNGIEHSLRYICSATYRKPVSPLMGEHGWGHALGLASGFSSRRKQIRRDGRGER